MISADEIREAYRVIAPHVRRTPVIEVDAADFRLSAAPVTLKLESLQHAGSFKARGAFTSLLTRELPAAGVVAASGGNHGAAVAFAAMKCRVPAKIFVPRIASPAKVQQIEAYGATLEMAGERYADALAASESWASASGALPIHAFDQVETLRGQGTVGLELETQAPHLTTLLVAVGGGGLIAGIASWYQGRIRIVGVEPERAPTLTRALEAGAPVDAEAGGVAADSLAPRRVGELRLSDCPAAREPHGAGSRRGNPRRSGTALVHATRGRRARRGRRACGASRGAVCGGARRARRGAHLRGQYLRGAVRRLSADPRQRSRQAAHSRS